MSPARPPDGAHAAACMPLRLARLRAARWGRTQSALALSGGLSPDTARPCGRAVPGEGLTPLRVRRRDAPRVHQ